MKKMFLDIETLPAEENMREIVRDIYERKLRKNKNLGTFEEYLEGTGLDGSFGRICCLSYAINDGPVACLADGEKAILQKFWQEARDVSLFVGFNVMDFDLRFIYQRSIILRVRPTQELSFARYRNQPIYDVMHEWSRWSGLGRTSLHGLAKALNLPSPKEGEIEGRLVAQAYADGRIKEIGEYCNRDVETTRLVYKRMLFED
jgi:hypothetical protein